MSNDAIAFIELCVCGAVWCCVAYVVVWELRTKKHVQVRTTAETIDIEA